MKNKKTINEENMNKALRYTGIGYSIIAVIFLLYFVIGNPQFDIPNWVSTALTILSIGLAIFMMGSEKR